eukprot:5119792-Amphidinium_carterae.1
MAVAHRVKMLALDASVVGGCGTWREITWGFHIASDVDIAHVVNVCTYLSVEVEVEKSNLEGILNIPRDP